MLLLCVWYLAWAGTAAAQETLYVGNLAPAADADPVRLEIGAVSVELRYRQFAEIALETGEHSVRAIAVHDGRVLASLDLLLRPDLGLTPVLYFAGDGSLAPYRLAFDQMLRPEGVPPPGFAARQYYAVHHEAIGSEPGGPRAVRLEADCERLAQPLPPGLGFFSTELAYAQNWRDELSSLGDIACATALASPAIGGFRFQLEPASGLSTRRAFLIGGAGHAPAQVLVVDGAERVALVDLPPPQPRALAGSRDHWFDVVRPDQGLSLFEVGGTGIVFGTWFTLDVDSNPIWFYFEGAKVQGIGRRDITVFLGQRTEGAQTLTPIGSGRLQYVDCNEAEFRVLLAEADFRTVRLRRSQPVSFCPVFD
ncbi:MAG TPA: hypothetical protein PKZ76_15020 [Xanthomonadaceae bacterium]|nr:hypothetical protein [Xanthomonadaceae bacterium]